MFFYIIQEIIVINKPRFRFSFYPVIIKQIDSIQMLSINILEILAQNSKILRVFQPIRDSLRANTRHE